MPPSSNHNPRRDAAAPPSGAPKRRATSNPNSGAPSRSSGPPSASGARPTTSRPRSAPRPEESRTVDLTAPRPTTPRSTSRSASRPTAKPVDPGTKRRAQKKVRARQNNLLAWTIALAVTIMIGGTAAGVWSELQTVKGRVAQKRSTLADLSMQLESGKKRLGALASSSGKERVLVENGFIKPGERLLLFPKPTPHKN